MSEIITLPPAETALQVFSAPAAQVEEIQWRNIKKVVDALADLCFGSVNDPKWGIAHIAIRHSLVSKYGLDQEARQASAFRPGKESAKPVRASLGATDQSAAVAQEHQPCELFPIARA